METIRQILRTYKRRLRDTTYVAHLLKCYGPPETGRLAKISFENALGKACAKLVAKSPSLEGGRKSAPLRRERKVDSRT